MNMSDAEIQRLAKVYIVLFLNIGLSNGIGLLLAFRSSMLEGMLFRPVLPGRAL